ncbi:MAG TPA: DMT family transporter [Anaeromyxobacteraceae bacterium]|nr:DMT family transporter [Anaeromyxobacteraceae bacterium]
MSTLWMYLFIVLGGMMQACGGPMNAQLRNSLRNPWLASTISFAVIVAFFICVFVMLPRPLPSVKDLAQMPWWAPLGGLIGAVQVFAGLTLVDRVGAGPFTGVTVTAALAASIAIDHFGLFHMSVHSAGPGRMIGSVLMIAGIALIARN